MYCLGFGRRDPRTPLDTILPALLQSAAHFPQKSEHQMKTKLSTVTLGQENEQRFNEYYFSYTG